MDYTVNTAEVTATNNELNPSSHVMFSFQVDRIAQEPNETLTVFLTPLETTTIPTGNGVFFQCSIEMVIVDSDSMYNNTVKNNTVSEPHSLLTQKVNIISNH